MQKYDNFRFPSSRNDYTLANAYSMNPSYPRNVSSYSCKSQLYDASKMEFDYYALKIIGYISVPETVHYKLTMQCDELCQLNMTNSGSKTTVHGEYNNKFYPR